jgi:hypothetical protein
LGFYNHLGFHELTHSGSTIYLGRKFTDPRPLAPDP